MSALAGHGARKLEAPKPRLLASIPLRFVRATGQGKKALSQDLPLVPFVDFLITLTSVAWGGRQSAGQGRARAAHGAYSGR